MTARAGVSADGRPYRVSDPEQIYLLVQRRDWERVPMMLANSEAAAILGVSVSTVDRMCARGDLMAVRCGRMWRINRDYLLKYAGIFRAKNVSGARESA